jgi:hypothetical protein
MSVVDFELDIKELLAADTHVAVHGIYFRDTSGAEWLTTNGYTDTGKSVLLLSESAPRSLRKFFVTRGHPAEPDGFRTGTYIPNVWLLGTAETCYQPTYEGHTRETICLDVVNGWALNQVSSWNYIPDELYNAK